MHLRLKVLYNMFVVNEIRQTWVIFKQITLLCSSFSESIQCMINVNCVNNFCSLTNPLFLLALGGCAFLWVYFFKLRKEPVVIRNYTVTDNQVQRNICFYTKIPLENCSFSVSNSFLLLFCICGRYIGVFDRIDCNRYTSNLFIF